MFIRHKNTNELFLFKKSCIQNISNFMDGFLTLEYWEEKNCDKIYTIENLFDSRMAKIKTTRRENFLLGGLHKRENLLANVIKKLLPVLYL
jgi:hypothetical protein